MNKLVKNKKYQELLLKNVIDNKYIQLKSDYRSMDYYYYDNSKKTMFKVCSIYSDWDGNINPIFEICYDEHILKLNSLL
jgi:hypothetical protein